MAGEWGMSFHVQKRRYKKDGSNCVWNGSDSGPDQCDPRQAK